MTDVEKFCNKRCCCNPCRHICEYAQIYLDGLAEGRKEGEELKAQIEKMKNAIIDFSKAETVEEKYNTYQKLMEVGK